MKDDYEQRVRELELRLREKSAEFDREFRARGFDPAQLENTAITGSLSRIYEDREALLTELEGLKMATAKETREWTERERISDQFRRAFEGEAWHGPSVLSLVEGVTAEQAAAHPVAGAHSIWELVLHIEAWERACKRRLKGDRAQLSTEEDWAIVSDHGEAAWEKAKQKMIETHADLIEAIGSLDESRLDKPIIDDPTIPYSSTYVTLHGGVQHDLYHAGQIAIIKKALEGVAS
jgi:uncharacterized damage-inducible protein DinB